MSNKLFKTYHWSYIDTLRVNYRRKSNTGGASISADALSQDRTRPSTQKCAGFEISDGR